MRNLELSQETAKRWYEGTDEELKQLALKTYPELGKKELPENWKELDEINGYYVSNNSETTKVCASTHDRNKNIFSTKEQAEALMALSQLSQLREVYRNGWVPDWKYKEIKFCIEFYEENISREDWVFRSHFLSFQDAKTRDLFLENFRDLIEKAKPLMS